MPHASADAKDYSVDPDTQRSDWHARAAEFDLTPDSIDQMLAKTRRREPMAIAAAEIKSWWDASFAGSPDWKLDRCRVEESVDTGTGTAKRSDLTVRGVGGEIVLAGELRLPDHPQADPGTRRT